MIQQSHGVDDALDAAVDMPIAFALVLLLVPGINVVAFLFANGYLLGREYFELVAFRHLDADAARG